MNNLHAMFAVAIMAMGTFLLRAFPFLLFSGKREAPKWLKRLGSILPEAIIGMLVVYCLKELPSLPAAGMIRLVIASCAVAALQWYKSNSLLSILGGTFLYMILMHVL